MTLDATWTTPVEYNPNEELPASSLNLMQKNLLFLFERPTSIEVALVQDSKASGTAGQAGVNAANQAATRDLNTIVVNTGGWLSLNSNQFSLTESGTYLIYGETNPGTTASNASAAIYNVTAAAYSKYGLHTTSATSRPLTVVAVVTITATTVFELRLLYDNSTTVLGAAQTKGRPEIYSSVFILKLA